MQLGDMLPAALLIVVMGIVLSFGATILVSFQTGQLRAGDVVGTNTTAAYNATTYSLTGLNSMAQQVPNLALVVIAAIIIGVLITSFGGVGGRR